MNERTDSFYVQQEDSGTFRVTNQDKYYVIREAWQGSLLLRTTIMASYDTEKDAKAEVGRLRKEQ